MTVGAWDIEALPGPQRHQGGPRYIVRHNGVTTESGLSIAGDRAIVIDMASGQNATRALLVGLLGAGQVRTVLSVERARVLVQIANHPAAYQGSILAMRAKLARRVQA